MCGFAVHVTAIVPIFPHISHTQLNHVSLPLFSSRSPTNTHPSWPYSSLANPRGAHHIYDFLLPRLSAKYCSNNIIYTRIYTRPTRARHWIRSAEKDLKQYATTMHGFFFVEGTTRRNISWTLVCAVLLILFWRCGALSAACWA